MASSTRTAPPTYPSWYRELSSYVGEIRQFQAVDWVCYLAWVLTVSGLFFSTAVVIWGGTAIGADFPDYVFVIPIAAGMFSGALAVDSIGHRTRYKAELARGEQSVHQMIIITAVGSVVMMTLAGTHPETLTPVSLGLIGLSFFYSALDEWLHWRRYLRDGLDRVEMWAHFTAILGHVLLVVCWWEWLQSGYAGMETVHAWLTR